MVRQWQQRFLQQQQPLQLPPGGPHSNYSHIPMEYQQLHDAYLLARANSRRSPDQVEFELHYEAYLLQMLDDINNRCYQPTAYTFVVLDPKPREIFASDMGTRILHHYLHVRLIPLLEARLSKHTYNNRKGMGTSACQAAVISDCYELSQGYTREAYIIKIDLSGCFPNISQDIAFRQLEEVILTDYHGSDKDDLLYILRICIYSYPTLHCEFRGDVELRKFIKPDKSILNKPLGTGAAIGHLIWQMAVTFYFNDIILWLESLGIHVNVYVDDWYFVVLNKTAFLTYTLPELRRRFALIGATINERKFYCQSVFKGFECLGIHVKRDRAYPNTRVIKRAKRKGHELNRCSKEDKISRVLDSLNSYFGICKNTNGFNQALAIVKCLNPAWFNYIEFDTHRCCLVAKPEYSYRNRIIKKYNLYDSNRKRRVAPSNPRATNRTAGHNGQV